MITPQLEPEPAAVRARRPVCRPVAAVKKGGALAGGVVLSRVSLIVRLRVKLTGKILELTPPEKLTVRLRLTTEHVIALLTAMVNGVVLVAEPLAAMSG